MLSMPRLHAQEKPIEELVHKPEEDYYSARNGSSPGNSDWDGYLKDGDYRYRDSLESRPVEQEQKPQPEHEPGLGFFDRLLDKLSELLRGLVGIILISLLLIFLVGYLVYKVVGPGGLSRKRGEVATQQDKNVEDEDLNLNWEERMRRAEAAGDLRRAVRCGYMHYLQLLQEAGEIRYRQDKTNADYYREIGDAALKTAFRNMSRLYEFSWYGQYKPSEAAYAQFRQALSGTKSRLQPA